MQRSRSLSEMTAQNRSSTPLQAVSRDDSGLMSQDYGGGVQTNQIGPQASAAGTGTGAVGTGAVGTGAVGAGSVGTGAVGTGAVGAGASAVGAAATAKATQAAQASKAGSAGAGAAGAGGAGAGADAGASGSNAENTGAIGAAAAIFFCHAAAEYYPVFSDDWYKTRSWIMEGWQGPGARLFRSWYKNNSEWLAGRIRKSPRLKTALAPFFHWAHRMGSVAPFNRTKE